MSKIYENNDYRLRGSKKKPKEPNPTADPVRSDHYLKGAELTGIQQRIRFEGPLSNLWEIRTGERS